MRSIDIFGWLAKMTCVQQVKEKRKKLLFCPVEAMIGNMHFSTANCTVLAVEIINERGISFTFYKERYLLRTSHGRYFLQEHWDSDSGLEPEVSHVEKTEAINLYHQMPDKRVSFEEAFDMKIIEA